MLEHLIQESASNNDVEEAAEPTDESEDCHEIPETMLECIEDNKADDEDIGDVNEADDCMPLSQSPSTSSQHGQQAKRKRTEDSHETSFEHPTKKIREDARLGIEKQAARMVERSRRKLKPLGPGDNVAIPTSQFDRSKLDSPNVIGVILSADEDGHVVGTISGRVRGMIARSHIEFIPFSGVKYTHFPDKELSL